MQFAVRGAPALVLAGLALAACGGSSSTTVTTGGDVATNPPQTDQVTSTTTATSTGTGGPTQTSGTRTVLATLGLNLRASPSTSGAVVGSLGEGTEVTVIGSTDQNGGWYNVQGETRSGWITANPQYSTARHMTSFASSQHGFSLLFPDTWSFVDNGGATVMFAPQSGGVEQVVVSTAANQAALGQPGITGYSASSGNSVEVFGVTGTLRTFDLGAGAAPGTLPPVAAGTPAPSVPGAPAVVTPSATPGPAGGTAAHLAEILLTVNAQNAARIDFEYTDPADVAIFTDIYNSMKLYAALPMPSPGAATATATST